MVRIMPFNCSFAINASSPKVNPHYKGFGVLGNKAVLEQIASYFKDHFPGLTAEAIICFLVVIDFEQPSVGDVARSVGMTEPDAYHHMSLLGGSGAGLINFVNAGDGRNLIMLTDIGLLVKNNLIALFDE